MNELSARPSGRDDHVPTELPSQRPAKVRKAPESMPSRRLLVPQASEGGRRVSRTELQRLAVELNDRDRAVMGFIDNYGFLSTNQVQQLHFTTQPTDSAAIRSCRRTLARLRERRLIEPLGRRIGGLHAGSAGYVWRLGPAGDRLLRLEAVDAPRARRKEPSVRFLDHRLAVADAACQLTAASQSGHLELLQVVPEPAAWRPFSSDYGVREVLKPDLYAETASDAYEDFWFIEVDRGTESLPTVLGQCEQYERYRRSGTEQAALGLFPRVVWLVPDERRVAALQAAITKSSALDDDLFRVAQQGDLLQLINNQTKGGDDA